MLNSIQKANGIHIEKSTIFFFDNSCCNLFLNSFTFLISSIHYRPNLIDQLQINIYISLKAMQIKWNGKSNSR